MNVLNETQAAEVLARQVAEQLDQGPIPQQKVIFEGKIMDRTAVAQIVDERTVASRKAAMFDVQDCIHDYLECSSARQRLLSNILYGLRYRIVGTAKQIFYGMNAAARETGHIDNFNEFLVELDVAQCSAEYAEQLGYAEFGSGMHKLKALLSVYDQWRRAAYADAESLGMTKYQAPDLREAIYDKPQLENDALAKALIMPRLELEEVYGKSAMDRVHNLVMQMQPRPADVSEEAFEVYKEIVTNVRKKVAADHEADIKHAIDIAPYIERIIDEAGRVPEEVLFHQLPLDLQAALIESVDRTATKIPDQLSKDRRVSTTDMALACVALRKLRRKLADVLSDSRFE